jgi:hypothetical protein
MRLTDFQRINSLYMGEGDEIEQVAWVVCDLYNLTYEQVDKMDPRRFMNYADKVAKRVKQATSRPWWMPFSLYKTNAFKITLGQFVEIQYWLQEGDIQALHLIASSIYRWRWGSHEKRANRIAGRNVRYSLQDVRKFLMSLKELVQAYKSLFEKDEAENSEDQEKDEQHPFIKQYGWLFAARQVAQHEGLNIDKAMDLPIIQALNDLAYLKSENNYRKHLSKK